MLHATNSNYSTCCWHIKLSSGFVDGFPIVVLPSRSALNPLISIPSISSPYIPHVPSMTHNVQELAEEARHGWVNLEEHMDTDWDGSAQTRISI